MIQKIKNILSNMYKTVAYIAIIGVILIVNALHIFSTNGVLEIIKNIGFTIIIIGIVILLNKFVINKLNEKKQKIILIIGLIVFLALEILSVIFFRVEYNWDFKWLMESSMEIAKTGTTTNTYYFKVFPNNIAALITVTLAIKAFGTNVIGAYILSIVSIFLAGLFTVLVSKKMSGNKAAINAILLLIGCMPLYLYAPIVYTDSLAVALPIAIIYFWMLARENKEKSKKKYYTYLIIMAVISVAGYYMKATVVIVLIAILLETIFCNKKILKSMAVVGATFIILSTSFSKVTYAYILKDTKKNDCEFPLTHWLMMGLCLPESEGGTAIGYGAYSQKDADFTAEQKTYQDKKDGNIAIIKERLNNFGALGYGKFLFKKFRYIWNDGTYYVLNVIGWDTINQTSLMYRMVLGDLSNKFVRPYMTYFNNSLFILILYAIFHDIKNKNYNENIRVIGLSIVGIALFLLMWEARSRYIYLMIPLFITLGVQGITNLMETIETKKIKKLNE